MKSYKGREIFLDIRYRRLMKIQKISFPMEAFTSKHTAFNFRRWESRPFKEIEETYLSDRLFNRIDKVKAR